MRDRIGAVVPIAAAAGAVGLCCGLPILLSLGVVGAVAGWSLQSWALIGVGVVLLAVATARWARWARHRRSPDLTRDLRPRSAHEDSTSRGASEDPTRRSHR